MNVTEKIRFFRECGRTLWNSYLRCSSDDPHASRKVRDFEDILFRLYKTMVLEPCGSYANSGNSFADAPGLFSVRTLVRSSDIFISRELGTCGYWDYKLDREYSLDEFDFEFVDFYDFEQIEWREFEYLRVVIRRSPAGVEIAGHHALIRFVDAEIFVVEQVANEPAI